MDQIHLMSVFVAVGEEESFAAAARRLDLSPAAITRAISGLEEKLGARLIERTPRRVSLSARGAVFLPAAREFLAAHERAMAEFSTAPCRLALGFVDHVAGPELSVLLAQLHAHDPSLALGMRIEIGLLPGRLRSRKFRRHRSRLARRAARRRARPAVAFRRLRWGRVGQFR